MARSFAATLAASKGQIELAVSLGSDVIQKINAGSSDRPAPINGRALS